MIPSEEIVSGQNIAARCDFIFAQAITVNGGSAPYVSNRFPQLKGKEIIFCKTDFLNLFLQCVDRFVERHIPFTVVTHDSDYSFTDDIISAFGDRPISWWAMNCQTTRANAIPIGIANSYCKVNLKQFSKAHNPTKLLYVNHRIHTFPLEREWLYPHFESKPWATVRTPSSELDQYKHELLNHKFVLCPRGNGVDTHRMWEALYSGVIPVVVRHQTHSMLEGNLPVLFVNHFSEVNEQMLNESYDHFNSKHWNMDMLKVSWWINKMRGMPNAD